MNEALITVLIIIVGIFLITGLVLLIVGFFAFFTPPVYNIEKCIGPGTKKPEPIPNEPHPADHPPDNE